MRNDRFDLTRHQGQQVLTLVRRYQDAPAALARFALALLDPANRPLAEAFIKAWEGAEPVRYVLAQPGLQEMHLRTLVLLAHDLLDATGDSYEVLAASLAGRALVALAMGPLQPPTDGHAPDWPTVVPEILLAAWQRADASRQLQVLDILGLDPERLHVARQAAAIGATRTHAAHMVQAQLPEEAAE